MGDWSRGVSSVESLRLVGKAERRDGGGPRWLLKGEDAGLVVVGRLVGCPCYA